MCTENTQGAFVHPYGLINDFWSEGLVKSPPFEVDNVCPFSWVGFATRQKWLVNMCHWDRVRGEQRCHKHFPEHPMDSSRGGGSGTIFTKGRESAEIHREPALCWTRWHELPVQCEFFFHAYLHFSSLSSRFTVILMSSPLSLSSSFQFLSNCSH